MTTAILAIDGGGSGCRAVLRRPGHPDLSATAGPANAYTDPANAATRIKELAATLSAEARIPVPHVTAGVAGCRLPEIAGDLAARLPFTATIVDDSVTAAHGALGSRDGVLIGLGTGSFFLRRQGNRITHIGGWGFTLGDCASGAWFGQQALTAALRAADGMGDRDALTEALIHPHPLTAFQSATPADYAALAPLVFTHADTPTARRLIARAVTEIELAIARLKSPAAEPIVLSGGLASSLEPFLPPAIQGRLSSPYGTPLDGALALAGAAP